MKKFFLISALLITYGYVGGQSKFSATVASVTNIPAQRTCGTMDYLQKQKAAEPKLEKRMNLVESQVQQWIQNHPNLKTSGPVVITVPVVIHVVWKTASQNISDAQIFSQIDVLNEDFRRLNADASNTPSWFTSVAADCEIEFCLAQRDPIGNSTTGITRTQTTNNSFNTNDDVKLTSQGGKDAWPRDDYLNIWVCNLGGSLLGYATFPGTTAWRDGVVCTYFSIGRAPDNPFGAPFDKGRTATHEVGHWFALYHTFQGGCAGTSTSTCSTNGDRVCDTPPTSSSNTGCPSINQNTCTETPTDQNDMHMNFMDYTNDACMNLFSLGQKSRMQAVLSGSRSSLQSSQGCVPVNLQNLDAGISAIITPNGTVCQSSITPEVTLKNFGLTTLTSVTINYQVDAGPVNTYSWAGSLATLTTQNVTLPPITASAGAHTFTSYTSAPNGGVDDDPANDNFAGSFTVQSIGNTLPFFEGFESPTFPPAGWQVINPDNSYTWERTTLAASSGAASTRMETWAYNNSIGQVNELIFPNLNLTGVTDMTFDIAYQLYSQTGFSDTLEVLISTDCGSSFTSVYKNSGQPLTTVTPYYSTTAFVPASPADWRTDSIDLSLFSGFDNVIIKFKHISDWENNLYLDNINIDASTTTAPAASFTASTTTVCAGETVAFNDQSTGGPISWEWTFAGGTPATSTLQTPVVTYNTPGTYDVTLVATNANGSNTLVQAGYITVNPNLSVTATVINITCNSLCDGEASVIIVGGTPGYAFLWSNGQTSSIATGLCGGNHGITITDTNGCTAVGNFTITEPSAMVLDTSSTDAACGASDGSATVNVTGGTSPYTYLWSSGGTIATEDSLPAGIYTVTVIDFNGCTASTDVAVDNPGPPNVSTIKTDVSCNGLCDGAATATVSGATPPYTYLWNDPLAQTSATADSLCAGSYFVLVADSNNCATTASATITEPSLVGILAEQSIDISCNGSTDGEIGIVATGGTEPLSYSIDSGVTFTNTTSIFTGLSAGTYYVAVQDLLLCTEYGSTLIITEPSAITAPPISFTDDTNGTGVGTASISVSGGTPPLNFTWSPSGGNDSTATGLFAGSYTVTVTDTNGCIYQDSVSIGNVTGISELAGANNNIRFYPNPSAGIFTFEIQNLQTEDINIDIYNVLGKKVFTRSIPGVKDITQKIDLGSLPGGIYFVKLFIADKVKYSRIAVVK